MVTVVTRQGRRIDIIYQSELCDPLNMGEYVRAYCHIHGSDHQRSLSINKETGWGHCFNAACDATVLVAEWNPPVAERLLRARYQTGALVPPAYYQPPEKKLPSVYQPVLLHPLKTPPKWQRDELAALLSLSRQMRAALVHSKQARAYLHERGIPLEVALTAGVGYLPSAMLNMPELQEKGGILRRWADRIIFPLTSPAGKGYIGRSLCHWQPGMDENTHKSLLDQPKRPRRWIKTNPAGWFGYDIDHLSACLILVEGAFDRLTLLSAGFPAAGVIALVGTATQADWYPHQVKAVILALDADDGGKEATSRLACRLTQTGICVRLCPPLQDKWGKDWNERWHRIGPQSVWPIYEAYAELWGA
ncbi:MAG: toprim domain-containing protein [Ktedonobacteraceae bacterium]